MHKTYLNIIVLSFLLLSSSIFGQTISWNTSDNKETVLDINKQGFTIKLRINKIDFNKIKTEYGDFTVANISGFGHSLDIGNPALPVYKKLIELPQGASYEVSIINKTTHTINLSDYGISHFIIPAQLPIPKVENPNVTFQFNKKTYKTNSLYSNNIAKIIPLGKMRSTSLARLEISPISYNPVKNIIEVIEELTIKITISNYNFESLKQEKQKYFSPYFQSLDSKVLNSKAYAISGSTKTSSNKFPLKYVIVSDSIFKKSLQPFIRWKEKKGYKVIEAYTQDSAVGSSLTSIKAYLQSLYLSATPNDPAPTFVLFVGDIAQMPAWTGQASASHITDLYYCEFTGDEFPEMMYGRFSATDTSELNSQINKTIEYETYTMPDPSFLGTSVLIAGSDISHGATYGDGQVNYGTTNYFNSSNSTNCKSYLYINGSGNKDAEIRQQIDSGVSIANYTAHGSSQGWVDPSFNVSDVANMTNQSKYPLMIGNACLTNKFDVGVCFGEALLRAKNKGAIGYIGASDNTLWDEDYYWAVGYGPISTNPSYSNTGAGLYDLIFHTHNEPFANWAMNSYQYMMAGNLAVTQGGSSIRYYWEVYHVMGDPSLMAYLKIPDPITANYIPFIQNGWTTYTVNTIPHALVAISQNDTLISSAMADSTGLAILELGNFNTNGIMNLVITAQNHAPFFANIFGGSPTGPYIIASNITINDAQGNNNGEADFDEQFQFDMDFVNLTQYISNATTAVLQINDNQVVIIDSSLTIGNINSYDSINKNNIFDVAISNNATDNHIVNGTIKIIDSIGNNWLSNLNFIIHAPDIKIIQSLIDDSTYGNNNDIIEAGEHIIVKVKLANTGSRDALNLICNYTNNTGEATVSGNFTSDTLKSNASIWANFSVQFNNNINDGSLVPFTFEYISGAYTEQQDIPQFIGQVDENFETGDFSKFVWKSINNYNWTIDTNFKYEGQYSSRSAVIGNKDTSSLYVNMHILTEDSISFYRKVSTEDGYDKLHFYIDNVEQQNWSGNKNWERFSYPVSPGMHTFKWSYIKDVYTASYLDATWIDFIKFPPTDAWSFINNNQSVINNIKVWPNPAIDKLYLQINIDKKSAVATSVYNQLGQTISPLQAHGIYNKGNHVLKINVANIDAGLYLLEIKVGKQSYFQKIIIK